MRYTTIIDLRDCKELYKNVNVRLVYLHLALIAGYHDHDRDIARISIRQLAQDVGLTVSAVRHAVGQLLKWKMITSKQGLYWVRKWVDEQPITTRRRTAAQQKQAEAAAERRAQQLKFEQDLEVQAAQRRASEAEGKNGLFIYLDELKKRADGGDEDAARQYAPRRKQHEAMIEEYKKTHQ